jgi:hypothetical protein
MVYKESPLCSPGSAFGFESAESLLVCLINLLPESFGPQSLCLSPSYISGGWYWIRRAVFSPPCHWFTFLGPLAWLSLLGTTRLWIQGERASLPNKEVSFSLTKEPRKAWEPTWEPHLSDW